MRVVIPNEARNLFVCIAVALLVGCGYPRFYEYPLSRVSDAEVIGTYVLEQTQEAHFRSGFDANQRETIILKPDHTAEVLNLEEFDLTGKKIERIHNGPARWRLSPDSKLQLTFGNYGWGCCAVLGHRSPYRLWQWIGDPDNGFGVLFRREKT